MARRYIGDAIVTIAYHDDGDYRGTIKAGKHTWKFDGLHAPRAGLGPGVAYDSPEAYDEMAASAVSFGSYYSTGNRGDDTPDWAPPPEVADAIEQAVSWAQRDDGSYEVRRSSGMPAGQPGYGRGSRQAHEAWRRERQAEREAEAGFAITVSDERTIEDWSRERFGDPQDRKRAMSAGLVDAEGGVTDAGWKQLTDDIIELERNSLAWMRGKFLRVRDEGYDQYNDSVGSFAFDPTDPEQAWLVELASPSPGRSERIDMTDASYGDLSDSVWKGVSDFGSMVLTGHITFHDVKPEDMEIIEQTLEGERKKTRRR